MTHPSCDDCAWLNVKVFPDETMRMCRLAARGAALERDQIVEHHRAAAKMVQKCGPKGLNFEARVAG